MAPVEGPQASELRLLLLLAGPDQLDGPRRLLTGARVQKRVHADDGQLPRVFLVLVEEALVLDLAALVHRLHRAEHAAALRDALELLQHRLLDQVRQGVGEERALSGVLIRQHAELAV